MTFSNVSKHPYGFWRIVDPKEPVKEIAIQIIPIGEWEPIVSIEPCSAEEQPEAIKCRMRKFFSIIRKYYNHIVMALAEMIYGALS